ncbi:uncharacterized protein LOC133330333 [Musca vetustissima]|uniref:uncharacterized protein LOC133330333 n=1 Tax=Musca vetustissima TaxID=27455 RepID=UPI002AB6919B|nr:uncharacterized protein LOC133330333 [Musca vetustissima]
MPENKVCTLCDKIGLKPFTKENIYYYYIPINGLASYGALSLNVMNPSLVSKMLSPRKDLTNALLLSSVVGAAFYIYGRPALKAVPNDKRGLYAILGGGLWAMGSVLFWAVLKSVCPSDNAAVATVAGLATGAVIVKVGKDYFEDIDKQIK